MAPPSRYHRVLNHEHWKDAFGRQETIESVLTYILEHWDFLQKSAPADMLFSKAEPKITKFFGISLRQSAKSKGIFGYFIPENPVGDIDYVKKIIESRGRTDITYFSDKPEHPIELVLEFKKLKVPKKLKSVGKLQTEYCKDGMLRFVDGIYARDSDVGFMVGLVEDANKVPDIISALRHAIEHPGMEDVLKPIKGAEGEIVDVTSGKLFVRDDFETRHARDHISQSDILLGHIILAHKK